MSNNAKLTLAGALLLGLASAAQAQRAPLLLVPDQGAASVPSDLLAARAALDAGHTDEALLKVRNFLATTRNGDQNAIAEDILGTALLLKGDTENGLTALRRSVALDPKRVSAVLKLGIVTLDAGRIDEARAMLARAVQLDPGNLLARQRLGAIAEADGDADGAIRHYEAAVNAAPKDDRPEMVDLKVDLANLYLRARRYADAVKLLAPVVTPQTTDVRALATLTAAYLGAGDPRGAMPLLSATWQRDHSNIAIGILLARTERANGLPDAALTLLGELAAAKPDSARVQYEIALAQLAGGDTAKAQAALRQAVAHDPAMKELPDDFALAAARAPEPAAVLTVLRGLAGGADATMAPTVTLAAVALAMGRPADAEAAYAAARTRWPNDPEPVWRLGAALAEQGKYADARAVLADGLKRTPADPHMLRDASLVASRLHDSASAIALAQRLVAVDPKSVPARFLLAGLYQDNRQYDQAIAVYREILQDRPDEPWTLNNLAAALTDNGDAAAAIPLARRAAEAMPNAAAPADTLGWALLKAGQPADAATALGTAAKLSPRNGETQYRLALAQRDAGMRDAAKASVTAALAAPGDFRDATAARALLAELSK